MDDLQKIYDQLRELNKLVQEIDKRTALTTQQMRIEGSPGKATECIRHATEIAAIKADLDALKSWRYRITGFACAIGAIAGTVGAVVSAFVINFIDSFSL
jgi:hypothetical protein